MPCIRLISIHAPPRGATPCGCSFQRATHFNSRPSARGDWLDVGFNVSRPNISIHAPPRGATSRHAGRVHTRQFQFTPLREGRLRLLDQPVQGADFNSRPSARGDCRRAPPTRRSPLFQFTPLREGRPHGDAVIMPIAPFQFTPLREGRPTCPAAEMMQGISIHAPPRGATIRPHQCCQICQFQFTPLREGRLRCCFQLLLIVLFQFTPLREGRRTHRDIITAGRDISIHAPPRGATPVTRLEAS